MPESDRVAGRFTRAAGSYHAAALPQRNLASKLYAHLPDGAHERILELGCGTGHLSVLLAGRNPEVIYLNDLSEAMLRQCQSHLPPRLKLQLLPGNAQQIALPAHCDLIVSNAACQWFSRGASSMPEFKPYLSAHGILAFSSFAPGTCAEIKTLTGSGLDYVPLQDAAAQLRRAGFTIIYARQYDERLYFASTLELLLFLKRTGVTAAAAARSWTKRDLDKFCLSYRRRFNSKGRVYLSWRPYLITARLGGG